MRSFPKRSLASLAISMLFDFATVYNNLQASGINKLLDILKAADVSTCADFDLDIAVDIFDGMDILLVFFVIV